MIVGRFANVIVRMGNTQTRLPLTTHRLLVQQDHISTFLLVDPAQSHLKRGQLWREVLHSTGGNLICSRAGS
jgi:hypothetical protein